MSEMANEVAKLSRFLTDHTEKFAAAFIQETGLDPTKVTMVQQRTDSGIGVKIWFEPFPNDSEIEMYRAGEERALAELAKARALIERLIEAGGAMLCDATDWWDGTPSQNWDKLAAEYQASKKEIENVD